MTIKKLFFLAPIIIVCFSGCKPRTLDVNKLYGKWRYIKVESPNATPPTSVPQFQIDDSKPYITFTKDDSLTIVWGGEKLSRGKFRIEGNNIQYTERMGNGQTREFPFMVDELTDKQIIFETGGDDGSKVTAVR